MSFAKTLRNILKRENAFFLIFLLPLVINPWGSVGPSELAKISFLMVFIGSAFFILALQTLFSPRIKDVYSWPVAIGLGLLLFLLLYSTFFSTAPLQSFWGTYERLQGLTTRLLILVFFVFCLYFFQKEARQRMFWGLVKGVGLVVALWGIIQYFTQDASMPWSSGQLFAGRIFGSLGNPNDFGQFLVFPFMAAVIGFFENKESFSLNKWPKFFDAFCLAITGVALILSQNRASILAVLVASAIYLIIKIKNTRSRWSVFLVFLLALGLFAGISFGNSRSFKTRLVLWQSTIELSREHPWFGTGLETYTNEIQKTLSPKLYQTEQLDQIPNHPHNETLAILSEQGIIGLAVYGFIMVFILTRLISFIKSKKTIQTPLKIALFSLLATIITSQFGFNLITQEVFMATSLAIVVLSLFKFTTLEFSLGIFSRGFVVILFLTATIVMIGFPVRMLKIDNSINKAVSDTFKSRDLGLESFNRLIDYSPPFAYLYRTVFIFFGQDLDQHLKDYDALNRIHELHSRLTNDDFEAESERATLAYAKGNIDEGNQIFEATMTKYPTALRVYELWASLAFNHKDYDSALKVSDKYISIAPSYWRFGENLEKHTPAEREQYRIFMKSNWGFQKMFEINQTSRGALLTQDNK